jgi:hypothetical protein
MPRNWDNELVVDLFQELGEFDMLTIYINAGGDAGFTTSYSLKIYD